MRDQDVPFIAVIGGLWQLEEDAAAAARETAKVVGAELAKAGFGLVVYLSDPASLEPHVVSGYCAALPAGKGAIRVRCADSQFGQVKFKEQDSRPGIFEHNLFPGQDWEAPFYRSLAEKEGVDGVVLLAGATSTLIAGQIAMARRLPILAINTFGGSAEKIWRQLAQASQRNDYDHWDTLRAASIVRNLKHEVMARRAEAERQERVLAAVASQNRQRWYAAGAFIFLLAALFFGTVHPPNPSAYLIVIFAGLIGAGATGALVRAIMWGTGESEPQTSLLLGSIAGFVVGFAYLIPQWIGAPGVLAPAAETISATDKIQFFSAILVAIPAGVGFDTVFNRLRKQAQDVAILPPPPSQ